MTGHRAPRQTVNRPAATTASAPASTAARQGTPTSTACADDPPVTTAPPTVVAPPVVDPAPPGAREAAEPALAAAADSTPEVVSDPLRATAVPTPQSSRTRRVAMMAARQASPARASAPAAGTRSWPLSVTDCAGSGCGAWYTARAQDGRTARSASPAPTAPRSSVNANSRRAVAGPVGSGDPVTRSAAGAARPVGSGIRSGLLGLPRAHHHRRLADDRIEPAARIEATA